VGGGVHELVVLLDEVEVVLVAVDLPADSALELADHRWLLYLLVSIKTVSGQPSRSLFSSRFCHSLKQQFRYYTLEPHLHFLFLGKLGYGSSSFTASASSY
jgi:hypothetical protein